MSRTSSPVTITVRAVDGSPVAFGFITSLTTTGARVRASVPLAVGAKLRFRIFDHNPPRITERLGEVLGADKSVNSHGNRCQVEWLSECAADEPGEGRGGSGGGE